MDHLKKFLEVKVELRVWMVCATILAFILVVAFGAWRVGHKNRLLAGCKVGLKEAKADKEVHTWTACKKIVNKCDEQKEKEIKKIDKKISQLKKNKQKIAKDVNRMKPSDLKNGFKEEGF